MSINEALEREEFMDLARRMKRVSVNLFWSPQFGCFPDKYTQGMYEGWQLARSQAPAPALPVEALIESKNLLGREIRSLANQGLPCEHPVIKELESHLASIRALLPSPPQAEEKNNAKS